MSGLHDPPLGESDTRTKLIDPAVHARGWTEEHIRREETAGAIEVIDGKPRRRRKGRVDYTLRVKVSTGDQPVALGVIEAQAENLPPGHGWEQAKSYARCKRLNVPFAFSSNGHMFVEYDNFTKLTSPPRPMAEFPTCDELRARYEASMGFGLAEEVAKPLVTSYSGGEAKRRYYQDAAIRAVFDKVAKAKNAVQVGVTPTPREIEDICDDPPEAKADAKITADNLKYFGEPVYEYSLGQGTEDGYMAACEIKEGRVNLDDTGTTLDDIMARNPIDAITGQPVTADQLKAMYEATSYETQVMLPTGWKPCAAICSST